MHKYWCFCLKSSIYISCNQKILNFGGDYTANRFMTFIYTSSMYLRHIINYAIQNTCHRWAWSWLSQAWNGVFIDRDHQRGENNSHVNRAGSLWAPLLLHDVNRKVKPGIFLRSTNEPISVSWTGKKVLLVQRKHNKKLKNSHKRNMAAKVMIKTVCKKMLY